MTGEFINKHCQFCDRCIFECNGGDQVPKYCGEIDEGGCICDPIKEVQTCYYGYEPIHHIPRFKVGDVIKYEWGEEISTIIAVNDDEYTLQKHGMRFSIHSSASTQKKIWLDSTGNLEKKQQMNI